MNELALRLEGVEVDERVARVRERYARAAGWMREHHPLVDRGLYRIEAANSRLGWWDGDHAGFRIARRKGGKISIARETHKLLHGTARERIYLKIVAPEFSDKQSELEWIVACEEQFGLSPPPQSLDPPSRKGVVSKYARTSDE